jgi:hypothetical protein
MDECAPIWDQIDKNATLSGSIEKQGAITELGGSGKAYARVAF